MKKILSALLAVGMVFGAWTADLSPDSRSYAQVYASEEYTSGYYGYIVYHNYGDHIEIAGAENFPTSVEIPPEIDGLPVTRIGDWAFGSDSLTSVTIPDGVTSIGEGAFSSCADLTSLTIPDSVTSIGDYAFYFCTDLISVDLSNSLTSISDYAFEGCTSLESVTIPDSVESIGNYAYQGCKSMTSVSIPDSVVSIGDFAFCGCTSLTSVSLPKSVASIGDYAFCYCTSMTEILVDENNQYFTSDNGVLFDKNKTALLAYPTDKNKMSYTIPDTVTSIGTAAFEGCSSLTSVTIPDSVTSIGAAAFERCKMMTSVKISDSVESIGCNAFYECKSLKSVTIPDKVTRIYDSTFEKCAALNSVAIGSGVTSIDNNAFAECSNLRSITVPERVTGIGGNAFYNCERLTSITIENPECEIYDDGSTICNDYDDKYYFNGTICGYDNSTAQTYAEKYGYKFLSLGTAPEPPVTVWGDADENGTADMDDVVAILCAASGIASLSKQGALNADIYQNGDGINSNDAVSLQKYLALAIGELPESYLG